MLTLTSNRLLLRDFISEDLTAYIALRSDVKFQRFYSALDASVQKSHELHAMFMHDARQQPRQKYQLAIIFNRQLIGSCGVRLESASLASMGCELDRAYHGKGLAEEAGKTMLEFAFTRLKLQRVYAEMHPKNVAAARLCRKLGMKMDTINPPEKTLFSINLSNRKTHD